MKVALLTQGYQSAGGVQAVARWLTEGLSKHGHEVTVLDAASSRRDINSRRLFAPGTWRSGAQAVASSEPGVIHVGSTLAELEVVRYLPRPALTSALTANDVVLVVAGAPALAYAARRSGKPVVLQVATTIGWERASIHRSQPLVKRILSKVMTVAVTLIEPRALIGCSHVLVENPVMEAAVARLAPDTTVVLAPPGVDTADFDRPSAWHGNGPIVSIGRLAEARKGWARMFEAYAALLETDPQAPPLVIGGRGQLLPADAATLDRLDLRERVQVHEDLAFEDLRALLHRGSVFWQTSYEEGLGIAAIEAMAAGLPVVASRTAGTDMSVRPGISGYLVDHGPDFLNGIVEATKRVLDDDGSLSRQAQEHAHEVFDSEVVLAAYLKALKEAR